jgi:hypothetical protein
VQFVKNVTNFKIEVVTREQIGRLKRYVPANRSLRVGKRKIANASFSAVAAPYDCVCAVLDDWFTYQRFLGRSRRRMRLLKSWSGTLRSSRRRVRASASS